jgi:hypothetical protein
MHRKTTSQSKLKISTKIRADKGNREKIRKIKIAKLHI